MHIGIDISPLSNDNAYRGTGSYTRELIGALKKYEPQNTYSFFTRGQKVSNSVDILHYTYFDPFFLTLPIYKEKPTVVTVHDLIPIAFSDHFPRGMRGEIKWRIQKFSLEHAKEILTDSNVSKNDIIRYTRIPENHITVIPLAPSDVLCKVTDNNFLTKVQKKYYLPKRFFLYVGDVNWNKNIPTLLTAFSQIHTEKRDIRLVLIGKQFLNEKLIEVRELHSLMKRLSLTDAVIIPGYLPIHELAVVYTLTSAYIQPSYAEGFGLGVLEAMRCGSIAIVADISSLAEIAGPAIRINSQQPSSLSGRMREVLNFTESQRKVLAEKCHVWSQKFTWRSTAQKTVNVYEKVLVAH